MKKHVPALPWNICWQNGSKAQSIVSQFCTLSNIKRQADTWCDMCRLGQSIICFLPYVKWQDTKLEVFTCAPGGRWWKIGAPIDDGLAPYPRHCSISQQQAREGRRSTTNKDVLHASSIEEPRCAIVWPPSAASFFAGINIYLVSILCSHKNNTNDSLQV